MAFCVALSLTAAQKSSTLSAVYKKGFSVQTTVCTEIGCVWTHTIRAPK